MPGRRWTLVVIGAMVVASVVGANPTATPVEASDDAVRRIVVLDPASAAVNASVAGRGQARRAAVAGQAAVVRSARSAGIDVAIREQYVDVVNGLEVEVATADVADLAALPGVTRVAEPIEIEPPPAPTPLDGDTLEQALEESAETPGGRDVITATNLTGVPQAHAAGHLGAGVAIAIVDSGIAYDHPALGGGGFPNDRVVGGYDFADDDPDPYDERRGSSVGHGTHVAGIAAGSDDHMVGVAPEADLYAYRVFGRGATTDATVLAALDRAARDDVDVVNLSLGATGLRASSVLALAVDQLVDNEVAVVASVGNGFAGPFNAASPAVADRAIAVGSTESERHPYLAFTANDRPDPIPYVPAGRGQVPPAAGTHPVVEVTTDCEPLPEGSLDDAVALFGFSSTIGCRGADQARVALAAGAVGAIHYNDRFPDTFPGSVCCGDDVALPIAMIRADDVARILDAESPTMTWGAYAAMPISSDLAGLMAYGSSWGPGNEGEFKPDIAAPGGDIFSSLPASQNHYGVMSGTSMATPHVAGMVALLEGAHPGIPVSAVMTALQTSARPLEFTGDPTAGLQPVAQQGSGRADVVAALAAADAQTLVPGIQELALGDLEGRQVVRRITVSNPTDHDITATLSHRPAHAAQPPYTSRWRPADAFATVRFDTDTITVPAGGTEDVTVRLRAPADQPAGTLLGGWIEMTPTTDDDAPVRVAYQAVAGDMDGVSAINPTFGAINTTTDNPGLHTRYFEFGPSRPVTLDFTDDVTSNDTAWVLLSTGFPMFERLRMQVLDGRGKVIATPTDEAWEARNGGAGTGLDWFSWSGEADDATPTPAGDYTLRLVFDKAGGDPDHAPARETWTSPTITIRR